MSRDNPPGAPTRSTEVEQEVAALIRHEEQLSKTVAELEQRLFKVLVPVGPDVSTTSGSSQTEPVRVPLADQLYNRNCGINRLNEQLQSIINRLEL